MPKNLIPKKKTPLIHNGHWDFPVHMGPPYVGFVYLIKDKFYNRFYIGKKSYIVGGSESNWKKYISSSKMLSAMIEGRPLEEFEFICLEQYKRVGSLAYAEVWSLVISEAMLSDKYYNGLIPIIKWRVTENITERHKQRLEQFSK